MLPRRTCADAQNKLNAMLSFHKMLSTATEDLVEAAKGDALAIEVAALEEKITECKENAMASLKKIVVELYLQLLSKPAPTAVATEALDASIEEAKALEVDEATIKAMKKRSDEAKKAQNAKKIADRKAKKPPADPPKPPDPPEAHPDVQTLKDALEDALAKAEAKLFEAKSAGALGAASSPELLTADALQDLDTRARGEAHPTLAALEAAVKTATEAQASKSIIAQGQRRWTMRRRCGWQRVRRSPNLGSRRPPPRSSSRPTSSCWAVRSRWRRRRRWRRP